MKKILITLFAAFYLSVSFGGNLSMHFCMGELVEWDLNQSAEPSEEGCDNCGMPPGDTDGCCSTETSEVSLDVGHKTNQADKALKIPDSGDLNLFRFENKATALNVAHYFSIKLPPLVRHEIPKFLLNRNFRI